MKHLERSNVYMSLVFCHFLKIYLANVIEMNIFEQKIYSIY